MIRMKVFLEDMFSMKHCNKPRETVDPRIAERFAQIREETHNIAGKAQYAHAMVERKHRSLLAAEAALDILHGDEQ